MPIYILQALNTETCLNCLWWQAWWFVTKKIKGHITLNWNIQAKAIGNFEKDIYLNHLATIYTGLISFQLTTKETCILTRLHPSFLKSQMRLVFMAVHSRYGCHYLREILCSTDSWRGRGSEEFTLPHLLQDAGELVHINRGGVVFSYSSKNWWEPNLEAGSKKFVMSRAQSGVALLSCKVWHLVLWPVEHIGWGGAQSRPCSIGQSQMPEWRSPVD